MLGGFQRDGDAALGQIGAAAAMVFAAGFSDVDDDVPHFVCRCVRIIRGGRAPGAGRH